MSSIPNKSATSGDIHKMQNSPQSIDTAELCHFLKFQHKFYSAKDVFSEGIVDIFLRFKIRDHFYVEVQGSKFLGLAHRFFSTCNSCTNFVMFCLCPLPIPGGLMKKKGT